MKGTISKELEQVLQNREARAQLRRSLTEDKVKQVTVGSTDFAVLKVNQVVRIPEVEGGKAADKVVAPRRRRR